MPWHIGFPEDRESYRSQARAKKRKELEESDRLNNLERIVKHQQKQIDKMREPISAEKKRGFHGGRC